MTDPFESLVSDFIRRHGLVGARLVVAVSGGPDSVCLMHVLASLRQELCLSLHAAHLDHGLRADSAVDAAYVNRLASTLDIPATVGAADVRAYRREKRLSIEEAAREVRYHFLAEVAAKFGTAYVVTGHTRNDQVETILLHIIRGTGVKGLAGLKPLTLWTLNGQKIALIRPLLGVSRAETETYCHRLGLEPRLDSTNLSLVPLRNRVRLELLPLLRKYNSGVEAALLRLSAAAGAENGFLDDKTSQARTGIVEMDSGLATLDKNGLLGLPPVLQAHLLRQVIAELLGSIKDIEMRHIDDIMSTMKLTAGHRIDLPYGLTFMVSYDRYFLGSLDRLPSPYPPLEGNYALTVPGVTVIPGWQVQASIVGGHKARDDRGLVAHFDLEKAGQTLTVRAWRPGDRFFPLGLGQEKKLARFMVDEKIPRHWRGSIPLLAAPAHLVWLVGYRLDDRVKVTDSTRQVLRLEFKKA